MDEFDFNIIGQAIKRARIQQGFTQTETAEKAGIALRHLQAIENYGQPPGFHIFYKLMHLFHISVDAYFFPEKNKSHKLIEIENALGGLNDIDLIIVESVIDGIKKFKDKQEI